MDINYYTYIDNQIGYTVDSIASVFFLLLLSLYFREYFYSVCASFFEKSDEIVTRIIFYGFISILVASIIIGIRSNYLLYKSTSQACCMVEGIVTKFEVIINRKNVRTESFYVGNTFFTHISPKDKKGLFGYDNKKNKCTIIGNNTPVRIYYFVDGSNNIINSIQTTIADLC